MSGNATGFVPRTGGASEVSGYLLDPEKWSGSDGIFALCGQHLWYTLVTLLIAGAIGFPIGLFVGHTRRGVTLVAGLANGSRALPSLGLLVLLVILCGPLFASGLAFEVPSLVVLILLAVPPIITITYAGIAVVDPAAVDAARGMGDRPLRIVFHVEIPCALPFIFSGLRNATLQVILTATIAAYASLGGLDRLIIDGRAQSDYGQMVAGAIVVDLLIGIVVRPMVSRGFYRVACTKGDGNRVPLPSFFKPFSFRETRRR
ncbi:ABC transporter permease [Agrobacterium tumefaciens]|uniref:ABC transporter permease n=1 Tax=Agrobacterium tumefaciens TaxID=358 RepID=UPI001E140FDE|nr:ABC transporter permease subunit [Agrobacterium tumefaciens]NTD87678.1 ABC transporter permease subunit [Agrobacterium tumefaciens]NTD91553.1 ABC transporter permease subunit [Agrobacterium tumefaciens]NTD95538.1 ABC transporter permease subunit [Agrobacterium tumefaciens]NTE11648.1 ABC transporter permease subunit [Agrobacterium tumefaciens]NTE25093.1 ABC transporter permease subunit [Agrobacterium tumefaciens]